MNDAQATVIFGRMGTSELPVGPGSEFLSKERTGGKNARQQTHDETNGGARIGDESRLMAGRDSPIESETPSLDRPVRQRLHQALLTVEQAKRVDVHEIEPSQEMFPLARRDPVLRKHVLI